MPELAEEMYCSQQICIPPSFPYLLRQYAKAAIRTQPGDLLRWSTAYFRCLALNLPPPVKPRLEYPIPKSHFGLTPGWLKALMHQLQNNLTVPFKVLWDRWIGACLQHENLIEVLCLGGFTDPYAIPWFRFVALCAAHLTESLTQTMILVCEILTEEPEGGSSMIPLEVFTDVYQYLAAIDASEPQALRNLYFTDSLLSLYREPVVSEEKESTVELEEVVEEESIEAEEEKEEVVEQGPVEDMVGVVISCPDIAADDYKSEEDFELQGSAVEEIEQEGSQKLSAIEGKPSAESEPSQKAESDAKPEEKESSTEKPKEIAESKSETKETPKTPSSPKEGEEIKKTEAVKEKPSVQSGKSTPKVDEKSSKVTTGKESVDTIIDYMPPRQTDSELLEDLEKVKFAQGEEGEAGVAEEEEEVVDYELEKLKFLLEGPEGSGIIESEVSISEESEVKKEELEEEQEEEEKGELIYIDAIPGIGPIVPPHLVEVVVKYMKECSMMNQHGMVMPRNVRHYNCPPLEVLKK